MIRLFNTILPILLIGLVAAFILKNSFQQPGMYPTHDGEIHIIRSLHFFSELQTGQFPVRMVPELAYGFGYPVFHFFYPFPYYLAAIFQAMQLSTTLSWKLMQSLVTILSLGFFYLWVRCSMSRTAATVATVVYALVPYRLLTLYVTGQIGGYLSLLWAPIIGLGLYKIIKQNNARLGGVLLAFGIAGMVTSHLLSIIIFFVPLFLYLVSLLPKNFPWEKVRIIALWSLIGLGLAAFYLVPFMLEKSWVKLGHQILVDHRSHWPTLRQLIYSPWGYGYSNPGTDDGMSFQLGIAVWASWALSALILVLNKRKSLLVTFFILTFSIIVFLMLSTSSIVWELVNPLQLLQYPWRLLAATSFIGAWLAGWVIDQTKGKLRNIIIAGLIIMAFYNVRNYVHAWPLDWRTDDSYRQDLQAFHGPTDISWELMPVTATEVPTRIPSLIANASEAGVIVNSVSRDAVEQTRISAQVVATRSSLLQVNVWLLPVWQATVNDQPVNLSIADDGTSLVPVERGYSIVKLSLKRTWVQQISDLTSLFSLFVLLILSLTARAKSKSAI